MVSRRLTKYLKDCHFQCSGDQITEILLVIVLFSLKFKFLQDCYFECWTMTKRTEVELEFPQESQRYSCLCTRSGITSFKGVCLNFGGLGSIFSSPSLSTGLVCSDILPKKNLCQSKFSKTGPERVTKLHCSVTMRAQEGGYINWSTFLLKTQAT